METRINNIENYTQVEIIIPDNSIFATEQYTIPINSNIFDNIFPQKTLIMGEYFTMATELISITIDVPPPDLPPVRPIRPPGPPHVRPGTYQYFLGVRYNFYKDEMLLYRFEIIAVPSDNDKSYSPVNYRKLIRIIDDNSETVGEIEPTPDIETYFGINDDRIGDLVIKKYRSKIAPGHWGYHTGFIIEVNNKEYGILAFYPNLRLYKNNEFMGIFDNIQERRVILYTFMAYKRLKQPDIFSQQMIFIEDGSLDIKG
jgi:hypothetical protein